MLQAPHIMSLEAVPKTICLNDPMQVFSRWCLVFPSVFWRCQSTRASKPHLTLQIGHMLLHVLLPKCSDTPGVHVSIPACLCVEPVPVELARDLE